MISTVAPVQPSEVMDQAREKLEQFGKIIEGPWYVKTTETPILLASGRLMPPSHIFYATIEVSDDQ